MRPPEHPQLAVLLAPRGERDSLPKRIEPRALQAALIDAAGRAHDLADIRACVGPTSGSPTGKTIGDLPSALQANPLAKVATRLAYVKPEQLAEAFEVISVRMRSILDENPAAPLLALAEAAPFLLSEMRMSVLDMSNTARHQDALSEEDYLTVFRLLAISHASPLRDDVSLDESLALIRSIKENAESDDEWLALPIIARNIISRENSTDHPGDVDVVMDATVEAGRRGFVYAHAFTLDAIAESISALPRGAANASLNRVMHWIESNPNDVFSLTHFLQGRWSREQQATLFDRLCPVQAWYPYNAKALASLIPGMASEHQLAAFKSLADAIFPERWTQVEWMEVSDALEQVLSNLRVIDYAPAREVFDALGKRRW
ncbi:hypothetical protein LJR230_004989 [Trinickia sp. LjRoot230]|uniref:hypothetical protein n=1 Tax=Trinickia sp. LjRoot230 TaxID=3342288 RepID=UPI003ECF1411